MNNLRLTLFMVFCIVATTYSQTFEISGKVINNSGEVIPFANILLLNASDSTFVKGTSSDDAGRFRLTAIPPKLYLLQASYVGRGSLPLALDIQSDVKLGALVIPVEEEQLDEVVVAAKRPTVQRLPDRLVFQVENTVVSQGNTWDILRNTPGLIAAQEQLQIRGRTANIYVNGRRIQLSQQESKEFLEGLSGNVVQSVEVYANPPANFDAEEGAVVNIITSKSVLPGYRGSIDGNFTQAIFPKYSIGTSHFLKTERLNVFANYNYSSRKTNLQLEKGINFIDMNSTVFSRWAYEDDQVKNVDTHSLNLNMDYELDDRNTVSFTSNVLLAPDQDWERNLDAQIRNNQNQLDSTFTTRNIGFEDKNNIAFDLSYQHKLKNSGKITLNGHYTRYDDTYTQTINSNYFDSAGIFLRNFGFQTNADQGINIYTGQLDYQTPLESGSIEAGAKISVVDSESTIDFLNFVGVDDSVDPSLSDDFLYDEKVYAAYVSFVKSWEKWSMKLGVRGELTDAEGFSVTLDQVNTQDFFEPFPSIYVLYSPNEKHSFSFDYGRNVQRPRYNDLNPFRYFFNENDFEEGNPELQPNFSNNFNLNYTLNSEFFFDLYFRDNGRYISDLVFQDNQALTLRQLKQNVRGSTSYGLDFTVSKSIMDPWFLYAYTSVFHEDETFIAVESGNQEFTNAIDGFYLFLGNYLTLSKDGSFSGELTFSHLTTNIVGSYVLSPITNLTLGLRKSLWNDRAVVSLSAEDLLGKANGTYTSRYLNQNNSFLVVPETQFVRFGFTYNFGNFRLEQNQRLINQNERDRLGNTDN